MLNESNFIVIMQLNKLLLIERRKNDEFKFIKDNDSSFYHIFKYLNSIYLADRDINIIYKLIKDIIKVNNVATFYHLAEMFDLPTLSKLFLNFIDCCFTMVVETIYKYIEYY